jgi:hypothetical protein
MIDQYWTGFYTNPPQVSRLRRSLTLIALTDRHGACAWLGRSTWEFRTRVKAANKLRQASRIGRRCWLWTSLTPQRAAPTQEVVLPGNTQAFIDSPIYARTNGYLRHWNVDIGARVKEGDLLAEIETPEIDQQLQQARADLDTATANQRSGARRLRIAGRFCSKAVRSRCRRRTRQ